MIHADVANSLLRFSRTPNSKPGARPYWDISLANRGDAKASGVTSKRLTQAEASKTASPPQKPATGSFDAMMDDGDPGMPDPMTGERPLLDRIIDATGPDTKADERLRLTNAYMRLWHDIAEAQMEAAKSFALPIDGQSVNAATATLWITFGAKGLQ